MIEKNNGDQIITYKAPDFMNENTKDVGDKEEDFEVLQVIGAGAFSQVLKVKSRKNYGIYAMKKVDTLSNPEIAGLENEEKLLKKLNHQNIVKCYNVFRDESNRYMFFIMELMNNGDLEGFRTGFENFETYPPEKILWKIFYDCLKGLVYLHSQDIIHRDIKPGNLFFDENLKIKIGDFNASIVTDIEAAKKFTGTNDPNVNRAMAIRTSAGTEG